MPSGHDLFQRLCLALLARLTGFRQWLARFDLAADAQRERWGFGLFAATLLTLFGLAVSNVVLGLTVLALPWTARWRAVPWAAARPLLAALGAYAAFLVTSIAASYEPKLSVVALADLFALSVLPLAFILVRGERRTRRLVDLLGAFAALSAAYGLAQYFAGYGALDKRIRGPFSHYMTFSGVLLIVDLLLAARLLAGPPADRAAPWPWRWLERRSVQVAALAGINAALLGSLTRSAWVGVLVGATVLLALQAPKAIFAYAPAAVVFVLMAPVPMLWRALSITDLEDASNYDRVCMVQAGLHMVAEKPLFGIGPEVVKHHYPIYRHPTAPRLTVPHLHDTFLELAAERGLTSLLAYLAMQGIAIAAAWRGYRRRRAAGGGPIDLHLGALGALLAFNIAGFFEYNWGDAEVQRLALVALALPFCVREANEGPEAAGG